MKKLNPTEAAAFKQRNKKKPVEKWQVIQGTTILFESKHKGLSVWWCEKHGINVNNIKAI